MLLLEHLLLDLSAHHLAFCLFNKKAILALLFLSVTTAEKRKKLKITMNYREALPWRRCLKQNILFSLFMIFTFLKRYSPPPPGEFN